MKSNRGNDTLLEMRRFSTCCEKWALLMTKIFNKWEEFSRIMYYTILGKRSCVALKCRAHNNLLAKFTLACSIYGKTWNIRVWCSAISYTHIKLTKNTYIHLYKVHICLSETILLHYMWFGIYALIENCIQIFLPIFQHIGANIEFCKCNLLTFQQSSYVLVADSLKNTTVCFIKVTCKFPAVRCNYLWNSSRWIKAWISRVFFITSLQ